MSTPELELLLGVLASSGTSFVLGAGASAPQVPTIGQLPEILAPFASGLSSFPAAPIPDSPLRQLIEPLIEKSRVATTIEDWMPGAMTSATVAALLDALITRAHWQFLPQYEVFHLIPYGCSVVSFNWDGLARARCPQTLILHPHGSLRPRPLSQIDLAAVLDGTQEDDSLDARDWLIPSLVMPGEENGRPLAAMRERVFQLWNSASAIVVVGYSFGLGSTLDYDRVWLDTFVEAMARNSSAAIHIVDPDALRLCGEISQRIKRSVNVYPWPFRWGLLATAILRRARSSGAAAVRDLRGHADPILQICRGIAH